MLSKKNIRQLVEELIADLLGNLSGAATPGSVFQWGLMARRPLYVHEEAIQFMSQLCQCIFE